MVDLNKYLLQHTMKQQEWMNQLEKYASIHHIPIMERVSMGFLTQLVYIHQPNRILEIGTAIGYSTLRMHHINPLANIVSIEKNEQMFQLAKKHIKKYQLKNSIELILGDGLEKLEQLKNNGYHFDFIFIDAAKAQYKAYFQATRQMLNDGGIIVCDNVLFKGYVFEKNINNSKRLTKIAEKLHHFNEWLMTQDEFMTTIVPIGDGLSISVKIIVDEKLKGRYNND